MAPIKHMDKYNRSLRSFLGKLEQKIIKEEIPLTGWTIQRAQYVEPGKTVLLGGPQPIGVGTAWFEETAYFSVNLKVPSCLDGEKVFLLFRNDGESLLYLNGEPVMGFDPNRDIYQIGIAKGQQIDVRVESSIRWQNLAHAKQNGTEYPLQIFRRAALITVDPDIYQCWNLLSCLLEHLNVYHSEWSLSLLEYARRTVKPDEPSLDALRGQAAGLTKLIEAELEKSGRDKRAPLLLAAGHSHLDLAYLWQAKETVRKCGRTFSNMLCLMDRYPSFHFTQSQPVLYEYAKRWYPTLMERIREYVRQGRWENVGGMYVEADGNIPSGESYIRQFVYGNGILQREFGESARVGWLPDTFGHSAMLPQIFKKCGIDYFYSAKLRSNEHYEFPFTSYYWEGIDGSRLLCTLDTHETYNGAMTLAEIDQGQRRYKQDDAAPGLDLYVFGYGDGGGGVTAQMLEHMPVYAAMPDTPAVRPGTALEYFKNLEKSSSSLPVWSGEQYYDVHQGTLTSHAILKKWNRKMEFKLYDTEFISLMRPYSAETSKMLDEVWKTVLFNQFHDVLPGSHQKAVTDQAVQEYTKADQMLDGYIHSVLPPWDGQQRFRIWNTLSFPRSACQRLDGAAGTAVYSISGQRMASQTLSDGSLLFDTGEIPAMGYREFYLRKEEPQEAEYLAKETEGKFLLENSWIYAEISKTDGSVLRLLDKGGCIELIANGGRGNRFELYEEMYEFYDAWNIHPETLRHPMDLGPAESVALCENGSLMAKISVIFRFSHSVLRQDICFYRNTRRIDFVTEVDWHETSRMLRTVFDSSVFAVKASFDLSCGNVERSTRNNFIYEQSQIETAAHKWADLSDTGHGLALLSDSKYGYSMKGSALCLTLLKAPSYPDAECDRGFHQFTYAVFPHAGDFRAGDVDREGYCLNAPLLVSGISDGMGAFPRASAEQKGIFASAFKYAQDGSGDIILRLYENHGRRVSSRILTGGIALKEVCVCDMLENVKEPCRIEDGGFSYTFAPYEIATFRLRRQEGRELL